MRVRVCACERLCVRFERGGKIGIKAPGRMTLLVSVPHDGYAKQ